MTQQTECSKKFDLLFEKLKSIDDALRGSIEEDRPGVMLRLDRLERSERTRSRLSWMVIGSAIAAIIAVIVAAVRG